jgi:hypothetical protein
MEKQRGKNRSARKMGKQNKIEEIQKLFIYIEV